MKKRIFAFGLVFLVLSLAIFQIVYADVETPNTIYRAQSDVDVRERPSFDSSKVGAIRPDRDYPVFEYINLDGDNEGWACIKYRGNRPCDWVPTYIYNPETGVTTIYGTVIYNVSVIIPGNACNFIWENFEDVWGTTYVNIPEYWAKAWFTQPFYSQDGRILNQNAMDCYNSLDN